MLNNSLFNEALYALRADLISQINVTSLHDVNGHTRLIMAMQISNAVEKFLRNAIHDGEQAAVSIDLRGKRID